jgi:hypothetical protein
MAEWIAVRTPGDGHVATPRAPFDPLTTDALIRAARRIRPGPSYGLTESHTSIYLVLLELAADDYGLYVGMTGLTPDERYLNHKSGQKASKWVQRCGIGLLPALYRSGSGPTSPAVNRLVVGSSPTAGASSLAVARFLRTNTCDEAVEMARRT